MIVVVSLLTNALLEIIILILRVFSGNVFDKLNFDNIFQASVLRAAYTAEVIKERQRLERGEHNND